MEALKWRSMEWVSQVEVNGRRFLIGAQWNEEWRVVFKWRSIERVLKWRSVEGVLKWRSIEGVLKWRSVEGVL